MSDSSDDAKVVIYLTSGVALEVEEMGFNQIASWHERGDPAIRVSARQSGRGDLRFQRMSITTSQVVRIVEVKPGGPLVLRGGDNHGDLETD